MTCAQAFLEYGAEQEDTGHVVEILDAGRR